MKISKFSVTNYRSITTAHEIKLKDITILVGKNNEGKSNLLGALTLAMNIMEAHTDSFNRSYIGRKKIYDWERDFPVSLQSRNQYTDTILKLEFELSDLEKEQFREDLSIAVTTSIPITIKIGKNGDWVIDIPKKGSASFKSKAKKIIEFISRNISFNNIPTIRTEKETFDVIEAIVSDELESIENSPEYLAALGVIKTLEEEVLDRLADSIKEPLVQFLPNIEKVTIKNQHERKRRYYRREFDISIDDGVDTSIRYKGDGIKSLMCLAMLKNRTSNTKMSVVTIEEPESHLHPEAIRQLIEIIYSLSEENQIIITTHNPLFINRGDIKANIIVNQNKATPAKNIDEIRKVLGVIASDNLISASLVLVVEGDNDKIVLENYLRNNSDVLKKAMQHSEFVISTLNGTGNLCYELINLRNQMCSYFVLMDNDEAGRGSIEKAVGQDLLKDGDCKITSLMGSRDSEFEDFLNHEIYKNSVLELYNVNLDVSQFRGNKIWNKRMQETFTHQGSVWNDRVEKELKHMIADLCSQEKNPFDPIKSTVMNELIVKLESMC